LRPGPWRCGSRNHCQTVDGASRPSENRRGRVARLVPVYVAVTLVTALPSPAQWGDRIVGSNRDAVLNLSVVDWVSHHLFEWHTLWQGQFFQPHPLTLAYSDAVLPQSAVYGILRPAVGSIWAFNLIEVIAWVASLWFCHCLLRRFTSSELVAVVGSIGWTFSTVRLAHLDHFQLVTAGALIPVVLVALLRYLDRPTLSRGALLGLSLAAITLGASYYGVMMLLATAVVGASVALIRRDYPIQRLAPGLFVGAAIAACLVVPVWWQYQRLQQDAYFTRSPQAHLSSHSGDLAVVSSESRTIDRAPVLHKLQVENAERPLYPGVAMVVLGVAGAVFVIRGRCRREIAEPLALLVAGVLMLLLSGGDHGWTPGWSWFRPYRLVTFVVPGFSGIRAPARFAIISQLALVALAVVGLDAIRRQGRSAFAVVVALSLAVLMIETRIDVPSARMPERREWTAVNDALRLRPDGLTLELPIISESQGWLWGNLEAPRQFLARRDGHERVNGYSGFQPRGFEELAARLNEFPSTRAREWLELHDVRYVIVRRGVVGYFEPGIRPLIQSIQPKLDERAIDGLLTAPPSWVSRARRIGDAILIELEPQRRSNGTRSAASP
jgi:hypothetical protein